MSRGFFLLLLLLSGFTGRAQSDAAGKAPAPAVRFFAVPWVEGLQSWHDARSNSAFAFRRGDPRTHLAGGLSVEMMPSPNVAIGLGLSVAGLGGDYWGIYKVETTSIRSGQLEREILSYSVQRQLDLTYLRTPFYVKITPHLLGPLRAYGLVGLEAGLLLSTRSNGESDDAAGNTFGDDYSGLDAALLGAAGLEWWFNANTAVFAGARYRHGFLNIQSERPPHPDENKPYGAGTSVITFADLPPYDATYPLRNRSLGIEAGVKFGPRKSRVVSQPGSPPPPRRANPPLRTL